MGMERKKLPLKILDIGCGTGTLTLEIARRAPEHSMVVGLDPVKEMLGVAKQRNHEIGKGKPEKKIEFREGIIENIPFKDNFFDIVVATMTTHHLERSLKYKGFKEVFRVLKSGGFFLNTDFGLKREAGPLSVKSALILLGFLYFNVIETITGNFVKTVVDNFTGMIPRLLALAGFEKIKYLDTGFKKAVFLKAYKPKI
jgi:ubiquinone/menaquinone biosynthesis C-methylase UbiE